MDWFWGGRVMRQAGVVLKRSGVSRCECEGGVGGLRGLCEAGCFCYQGHSCRMQAFFTVQYEKYTS